ncbi:MAG: hypothetical protein J6T28_02540 [Paludibacteraceae bacterium]|nr:hypothetical protein [Paludibacteraceae bacterium]MBP5482143.1 hypothetical protein [Paludibacteraceae bacterium]
MKKIIIALFALCMISPSINAQEEPYYPTGYKIRIERVTLGLISSKSFDKEKRYNYIDNSIALCFGKQQNKHLYYGVGSEMIAKFDIEDFYLSLPLFAEIRADYSDQKISPYAKLKVGYSISLIGTDGQYYELYQREDGKWFHLDYDYKDKLKGIYLRPELGVRFKIVDLGFCVPILEFVREIKTHDSQYKNTRKSKEKNMDIGGNIALSFHINI